MTTDHKRQVTPIDLFVSGKIREAREAANLTREDLAGMLILSTVAIYKYEEGINRVSAGRLHMIALVTGKPISWFFPS